MRKLDNLDVVKLWAFILFVLLVTAGRVVYGQAVTMTPKRAFDYYNEVGVNTHLLLKTTVYYTQFDSIIYPELRKLGIKNIRDVLPYSAFMYPADSELFKNRFIGLHDSLGIKMCFLLNSRKVIDTPLLRDSATFLSVLENSAGLRNATKYMEGWNEPDLNIYNWYPENWDTLTYEQQRGMYNRMQSAVLSSIPTLSPSFIEYWTVPPRTNVIAAISPHISNYYDFANFHTYDTGDDDSSLFPGWYYDAAGVRLDTIRRDKPWVITEEGYENARLWNVPDSAGYAGYGNHYVSELAAAKYCSVLFMEMFGRGATSVYTYEFIDENTADPASVEMNFGLLHTDGTEKPAFTVIKNTLQLFKDTAATYSPVPLSFALTGDTAGIKYAVYQRYNGDYLLALWQGRGKGTCYDFTTFTDLPTDSERVQIAFPFQYPTANVYLPLISDEPVSSYSNSNVLDVYVPDHLVVVEIKAGLFSVPANGATVTVAPNPTTGDAYVAVTGATGSNAEVVVTDIAGRVVYRTAMQLSNNEAVMVIPHAAVSVSGVYMVRIVTGSRVETRKLVVE